MNKRAIKSLQKRILKDLDCNPPGLPENLDPCLVSCSLLFTDDLTIRGLNRDFRHKDKATDVLSFPFGGWDRDDSGQEFWLLGELAISMDTVQIQAKKFERTRNQEILRLLIHGTLHLFGYDHEGVPASEAARMRRKERKIYGSMCDSVDELLAIRK